MSNYGIKYFPSTSIRGHAYIPFGLSMIPHPTLKVLSNGISVKN